MLVIGDQSKHAFYSRDLRDTSQNGGRTSCLVQSQRNFEGRGVFCAKLLEECIVLIYCFTDIRFV